MWIYFLLCHFEFRYVGLSLCYVDFSFHIVSLSLCYVNLLFRYVNLSFCYVNLSFHYVSLSLCYVDFSFRNASFTLSLCYANVVFCYVVFYVVMCINPSIISVTATQLYLPVPNLPTLHRKMPESLVEGRTRWGRSVEFGRTGRSSLGWDEVG